MPCIIKYEVHACHAYIARGYSICIIMHVARACKNGRPIDLSIERVTPVTAYMHACTLPHKYICTYTSDGRIYCNARTRVQRAHARTVDQSIYRSSKLPLSLDACMDTASVATHIHNTRTGLGSPPNSLPPHAAPACTPGAPAIAIVRPAPLRPRCAPIPTRKPAGVSLLTTPASIHSFVKLAHTHTLTYTNKCPDSMQTIHQLYRWRWWWRIPANIHTKQLHTHAAPQERVYVRANAPCIDAQPLIIHAQA